MKPVEKSLTMPKLGATMTEGTVLRWLFQPGERVTKGEPLLEIMTDKVNIEVEAPISGRLVVVLAHDGDTLPIGAPLATLEGSEDAAPVVARTTDGSTPVASTPAAKREAALRGISLQAVVQAGFTQPVSRDDVVAFVKFGDAHAQEERVQAPRPAVQATPLAQKIAREYGVDLASVEGHAPGAKVTRSAIEAHLREENARRLPPPAAADGAQDEELLPLTHERQLIGRRMLQSVNSAPHIYLDLEIDMTEAERCRQQIGRSVQQQGEGAPSITALVARAATAAIVLNPDVNDAFAEGALQGRDAIRRRRAVHIAIAVDTARAVITPVVREAQRLALPALARELRRLTLAAREGALTPAEVTGATFT